MCRLLASSEINLGNIYFHYSVRQSFAIASILLDHTTSESLSGIERRSSCRRSVNERLVFCGQVSEDSSWEHPRDGFYKEIYRQKKVSKTMKTAFSGFCRSTLHITRKNFRSIALYKIHHRFARIVLMVLMVLCISLYPEECSPGKVVMTH